MTPIFIPIKKKEYWAVKDHTGPYGADHKHWKWFAVMDGIHGERLVSNGSDLDTASSIAICNGKWWVTTDFYGKFCYAELALVPAHSHIPERATKTQQDCYSPGWPNLAEPTFVEKG